MGGACRYGDLEHGAAVIAAVFAKPARKRCGRGAEVRRAGRDGVPDVIGQHGPAIHADALGPHLLKQFIGGNARALFVPETKAATESIIALRMIDAGDGGVKTSAAVSVSRFDQMRDDVGADFVAGLPPGEVDTFINVEGIGPRAR